MKTCWTKEHKGKNIVADYDVVIIVNGHNRRVYMCDACYTKLRTGYERHILVTAKPYDPFLEVNLNYKEEGLTIDQRLGRITLAIQHAKFKADHNVIDENQDHVDADDLLLDAIRFLCAHNGTTEDCEYLIAAYNMITKTYSY